MTNTGFQILTPALRGQLIGIQRTQAAVDAVQLRLASGKKVNTAIDNPNNFFTAKALDNRAGDLRRLLDGIGQNLQVIEQADNALKTTEALLNQSEAILNELYADLSNQDSRIISYDDFGEIDDGLNGWSGGSIGGVFENGPVNFGSYMGRYDNTLGSAVVPQVSKIYEIEDTSEQVVFEFDLLEIDSWDNEAAVVFINGTPVVQTNWQHTNADESYAGTVQINGMTITYSITPVNSGTNDFGYVNWSDQVHKARLIIENPAEFIELGFSTTIDQAFNDESFGIDNVALYKGEPPEGPGVIYADTIALTADNDYRLYVNGNEIASDGTWQDIERYLVQLEEGDVVAIEGIDTGGVAMMAAAIHFADGSIQANRGFDWRVSTNLEAGWNLQSFDDAHWDRATDYGAVGVAPWGATLTGAVNFEYLDGARHFWSGDNNADDQVYLRFTVPTDNSKHPLEEVLHQIDLAAADASYRGTNLLEGDDMITYFNEHRTSSLLTEGGFFTAEGLGIDTSVDYDTLEEVVEGLVQVRAALEKVRNFGVSLANDFAILGAREDFIQNMVNDLREGSDKLTVADQNEEGAKLLALQTRQQIQFSVLSFDSNARSIADFLV